MKIKSIITLTCALFSLTWISCHQVEETKSNIVVPTRVPVRVVPLEQIFSVGNIRSTGFLTTDDETTLSFKNGGIVNNIYVREGDAVKKNQIIASLNTVEINSMVNRATLALEKSQRDFNRVSQLYRDSVATLEQMQNAETAFSLAKQELNVAKFNFEQAQLRSPTSGFVMAKMANEGQVVGPGMPVVVVNGTAKNEWLVKLGLNDNQWASVRKGDQAILHFDAFPNRTFKGEVKSKSENINPQTGTFTIQLKVLEPDHNFATGLFATAEIITSQKKSGWEIPFESMLDGNGKNGYVFVSDDSLTVRKIPVKIDKIDKDKVTVSEGLEETKFLIISGSPYLRENSQIQIIE